MPLVQRISRLLRADAHAVLDQIETPREMLRQSIRDMQSAVFDNDQSLRDCRQRLADVKAQKTRTQALADAINDELDLCLDEGKEDLARQVIRRKLGIERRMKALDSQAATLADESLELESVIERQRRSLDSMRLKAEVFLAEPSLRSKTEDSVRADEISESDIDIALLREQRRRERS